jgi:acid phosphatase
MSRLGSSFFLVALFPVVAVVGIAACGTSSSIPPPNGASSGDGGGSNSGSGASTGSGSGTAGSGTASAGSVSSGSGSASAGSGSGGTGGDGGGDAAGVAVDAGAAGNDAGSTGGAKFDHLIVILMENHKLSEIYGPATYMTQLADQNVLLQNYTAVDHPSEPNYLAIASGQTFNPPSGDDLYHVFNAKNVVDGLESAGKTWKAFSESASMACDIANPDVRHVPFLFFADVANDPARCARVLPTTPNTDAEVVAELNSATPSNFIWLTPNDANNMHSAPIAAGDAYLSNIVPKILASTTFTTKRAALFIVFDEGSGNVRAPGDLVYAVWAGPVVKKAQKITVAYSHYSVLATLEANWGFPALGANDSSATSMMPVFQ